MDLSIWRRTIEVDNVTQCSESSSEVQLNRQDLSIRTRTIEVDNVTQCSESSSEVQLNRQDLSIRPRTIGVDNLNKSTDSSSEIQLDDNDANQETVETNSQTTNAQQIQVLLPHAFRSTVDDAISKGIKVQMKTPLPQERPDEYVEQHVFRATEQAFIIAQNNGRFGIVEGRVTECYTNIASITIYVIDVSSHATLEYHMPRFLCFHYPEDASFVLQHLISEEERKMIMQYSTPYASREVAEGLQYNLSEEYARMFMNDTRPNTQLKQRNFPGPVALGLPPSRLQHMYFDEETISDDEKGQRKTLLLTKSPSRLRKRSRISKAQVDADDTEETTVSAPIPKKKRDAVAEQCLIERPTIVTQAAADAPAYNCFFRREFGTTSDILHNVTLMRRCLESAKENVTWFVASRTPNNVVVNYNDLYDGVALGSYP
ncbi:unnamed protein product [Orchesella dallaii]|uniref:Uncharacterized protein n=1 Tax=Orchesella dallaii TaxID=48710 RepID=A0ABP1PSR7_9HEXA